MVDAGYRHSKRIVARCEKALKKAPLSTHEILEALRDQGVSHHLPSVNRLTNILSKNRKFKKLTFKVAKNRKRSRYGVSVWCLTEHYHRDRKSVVSQIYNSLN